MSKFLTELDVRLKPGRDDVWELLSPLIYESDLVGRIEVPTEFNTDFASVPRVPIVYWFWGGRQHREAVLHDYVCRKDSVPIVSYSVANLVFLEAAKSRKKKLVVRYPMYWGTVVGAWTAFHKRYVGDSL